jgi:Icc-related predicted phosphoesterase
MAEDTSTQKKIRIAALGDIHMEENKVGKYKDLLSEISHNADLLCLCGDLTDHGLATEAQLLAEEFTACSIPVVGVLGNHDYDKDMQRDIIKILAPKIHILNGTYTEINGIHFAGVKGFGGGFAPMMWGRIGEYAQKVFYDEAEREAEQLENAINELVRMQAEKIVVLLHFSPIKATVVGDQIEWYSFLGSSRFEEVIDRYTVEAVFHAHSHFGSPEGKTGKGFPVFNVSYPLMQRTSADHPYRIYEI